MPYMDRTITSLEFSTDVVAEFEHEWIGAWNAHDIDRILSHYRDDVRFVSPFAARFGAPHGVVRGLPALRDYFERGLASYPALRFEPLAALGGIGSIALYYRSVEHREAIEVMELDARGQVRRVAAHYGSAEGAAPHDRDAHAR
jgi:SnoaL-like domain